MQFTLLLRFLGIIVLFISFSRPAPASHLYGSDFTYEYVGPSSHPANPFRYKLKYQIYTGNVNNISAVDFSVFRKDGTLIRSSNHVPAFTSPPIPLTGLTGCPVSNLPTIRLWTYELTIDLPLTFDGYFAIAGIPNRNNDITNLQNPGGAALFSYIEIPPSVNPSMGPVFADTAMVLMYTNDTTFFSSTALDAEGDKLTYSFQQPFSGAGTGPFIPSATVPQRANYASGYSLNQPFGAGSSAIINSNSGVAKFFAPTQGNYVVTIQVKEYRSINGVDVLIGSSLRDIQLIVRNNPSLANTKPSIALSGQTQIPTVITITEGEAISPLNFTFNDPDAGQKLKITVTSPLLDGSGPKNAHFNSNQGSPSNQVLLQNQNPGVTGNLNYTSKGGEAGMYPVTISVMDNHCVSATTALSMLIHVNPYSGPNTFTGDTTVVANTASEVYSIPNKAGATYNWNLQSGGTIVSGKLTNTVNINWHTAGRYKLTATESAGSCCTDSLSFYVNVATGSAVGTAEDFLQGENSRKITLKPNPAQKAGNVNLTLNQTLATPANVYVYDMLGKQVMQYTLPKDQDIYVVPVNNLKSGLYMVSLENGNIKSKAKLVIQ